MCCVLCTSGFLFGQLPRLLGHHISAQLAHLCPSVDSSPLQRALQQALQKHWHALLQSEFYRTDREGPSASRHQDHKPAAAPCGLQRAVSAASAEVERVHEMSLSLGTNAPPSRGERAAAQAQDECPWPDQQGRAHYHHQHQLPRASSTTRNVKLIGPELSTRGDAFHIIACQDDFTYCNSNVSVKPYKDVLGVELGLPGLGLSSFAQGFDGISEAVALCERVRHVCRLFEDLFALGVTLVDSLHHQSCKVRLCSLFHSSGTKLCCCSNEQNDYLFSLEDAELKHLKQAHLASWFDSCADHDYSPETVAVGAGVSLSQDAHSGPERDVSNISRSTIRLTALAAGTDIRSLSGSSAVPKLNLGDMRPEEDEDLSSLLTDVVSARADECAATARIR